jgi:LAO/AO transport system kinase
VAGRRDWTRKTLAAGVRTGDRRALARAITLVENGDPLAYDIVADLYPETGKAYAVGVTGPPGVGKSSLVSVLIRLVRERETTVGVVSVDPSSPFTHGALLGDRIRLADHFLDPGVFIRSMGTRGHLGGLAEATLQALLILDAGGKDLVFLETVGTGQSEVEVAAIADTTLVVQAPEMGDEVQAIKAGLLEVADIVAVNKGDRPGADRAASHLRAMLTVGAQHDRAMGDRPRPKRPEVMLVSGLTGAGVPELLGALDRRHQARVDAEAAAGGDGPADRARFARAEAQLSGILAERLRERLRDGARAETTQATLRAIASHELDPYSAADQLLESLAEKAGGR